MCHSENYHRCTLVVLLLLHIFILLLISFPLLINNHFHHNHYFRLTSIAIFSPHLLISYHLPLFATTAHPHYTSIISATSNNHLYNYHLTPPTSLLSNLLNPFVLLHPLQSPISAYRTFSALCRPDDKVFPTRGTKFVCLLEPLCLSLTLLSSLS